MLRFLRPSFLLLKRRIAKGLRLGDDHAMLIWAVVCGLLGASATVLFREGIHWSQIAMVGRSGSFVAMATALPWYWRVALPALGGVLAGCVLALAKNVPSVPASDYMEAVAVGDGKLPVVQSLLRCLSSLISVVSGGSLGREGSMVQLAALAASLMSRIVSLEPARLRMLVACGAAAGLSSAYNAPIAGAVFVTEIVIGSLAMRVFGPVLVSAVVANILMRQLPGYQTPYEMPEFPTIFGPEIVGFIVVGVACGVVAPQFLRMLKASKRGFGRLPLPLAFKLGLGGLGVGVISVWMPQVWGNGYSVVNTLLLQSVTWEFVVLVLICKVVATALTTGSGAIGGVFTPTLFVGAALGHLAGIVVHSAVPGLGAPLFTYVVVGMGALLAATTGAPLMAILMLFEMTMRYQAILPLILASVVAYIVARSIGDDLMYDVAVRRNGEARSRSVLRGSRMDGLIRPADTVVTLDATFDELAKLFAQHPVRYAYVVDDAHRYKGVVCVQDMTKRHAISVVDGLTARHLLQREAVSTMTPATSLTDALQAFLSHRGERLPVVSDSANRLLGVVYKSSILEAYGALARESHC